VYTLAKMAQWRAFQPVRKPEEEILDWQPLLSQKTFDLVKEHIASRGARVVFRYSSIMAAIRLVVAHGRPDGRLTPSFGEAERLGEILLALNRLLNVGLRGSILPPPPVAHELWLGELAVLAKEHSGHPSLLHWAVGASIFRKMEAHPTTPFITRVFSKKRWPSPRHIYRALTIWFGHSLEERPEAHLYHLPQLDRVNRAAAWVARRLAVRRKDGQNLLAGWCASPASVRLWQKPFFVHRGTGVCADPLSLAETASHGFGRFIADQARAEAVGKRERSRVEKWAKAWNISGFEEFVRDEMSAIADVSERPSKADGQECDSVHRFGTAVLFMEVKLKKPSPSTLQLRDRRVILASLHEHYCTPGARGLSQVLATMQRAAQHPTYLSKTAPVPHDRWWALVITAETVPCSIEWREEWRNAALAFQNRPHIQPFLGPLFFTVQDLCWLSELVRQGNEAAAVLEGFMASQEISFANYASRLAGSVLPEWVRKKNEDHLSWFSRQ